MYVSPYTTERVAEYRRQDMLREAARERLARNVGRRTVREGRERRYRLNIRQPLGALLVRLGTRLAGTAAGRSGPAPQQGVSG